MAHDASTSAAYRSIGSCTSRPRAPASQPASRSTPATVASARTVAGEVGAEDAGRRTRQEVLVDDRVEADPAVVDQRRRRRPAGGARPRASSAAPADTAAVNHASPARASSRSVPGIAAAQAAGSGGSGSTASRPAGVSAMPRASTSPNRTRSSPGATEPSAARITRGSASARNDVWRSSTSGPSHRGGPWISSIISMPRSCIRRYSSSMSSTRGVRWLTCVRRHPGDVGGDAGDRGQLVVPRPGRSAPATARTPRSPGRGSARSRPAQAAVGHRAVGQLQQLRREQRARADEPLHPRLQVGVEEPPVLGHQHRGEHAERVAGQLVAGRPGGTPSTRPAAAPARRRAGRSSRPGACPSRRTAGRPARARPGCPTRIAPCRSAVTRSRLPSRSAALPSRASTSALTSWATSTSVVYAGTSPPYIVDSRAGERRPQLGLAHPRHGGSIS